MENSDYVYTFYQRVFKPTNCRKYASISRNFSIKKNMLDDLSQKKETFYQVERSRKLSAYKAIMDELGSYILLLFILSRNTRCRFFPLTQFKNLFWREKSLSLPVFSHQKATSWNTLEKTEESTSQTTHLYTYNPRRNTYLYHWNHLSSSMLRKKRHSDTTIKMNNYKSDSELYVELIYRKELNKLFHSYCKTIK